MKTSVVLSLLVFAGCQATDDRLSEPGVDELALAEDEPEPDEPEPIAPTAFRLTDLDLRDPHIRVRLLACIDVTDAPLFGFSVNGRIQTTLSSDTDADGLLDFSPTMVFRPLDQHGAGGPVDIVTAACTATAPTTCSPGVEPPTPSTTTNTAVGTCLAPIAGTTSNYSPAITRPTNDCYATSEGTLQLELAGIPITLSKTQVAARYSGDPATGMTAGLLRGFISEADANAAILPADLPLVGGKPLSSLLAGGAGNCASRSDKDSVDGVSGWWFYLNFTAQQTDWVE